MSKLYTSRAGFGVIAGIIGGIVMLPLLVYICGQVSDEFMMMMNMKPMMMSGPQPILVAMGQVVVPGADMSTAQNAAIVVHLLTAVVLTAIFAVVTAALYKPSGARKFLGATNAGTGLIVGVIYGAVVWVVFFLPLLIYGFLPNLAAMTAMDLHEPASKTLMDMMNSVGGLAIGLTFAAHLFYGAVIGLIVGGLSQWKKTFA